MNGRGGGYKPLDHGTESKRYMPLSQANGDMYIYTVCFSSSSSGSGF